MNTKLKNIIAWGFILWLIGYILGFIFFMILPHNLIGWAIMPLGIFFTLFILYKKFHRGEFSNFLKISIVWTAIAIIFDYIFIVKLLKPNDGYYKLDVYGYYILTFLLPLAFWKLKKYISLNTKTSK